MTQLAAAGGAVPEPAALTRVHGEDQVIEFSGISVATATTLRPGKPRWLDMELWRVTDGTGRYVVQRVGRSLVYHRHDGPCGRGVAVPAADLGRDSSPCPECGAPALAIALAMPGSVVMREAEHPSAAVCDSAADVLQALRLPDVGYSAPAQRLLDAARLRDPAIAAAMTTVRRL